MQRRWGHDTHSGLPSRFNPHPARRPDAAGADVRVLAFPVLFQSSPGPEAGCSSPLVCSGVVTLVGFNPHPARRPDAASTGS